MAYVSSFDELLDLNALHNWPIKKNLTAEDVSSGTLALSVHDVESYIVPRLPADKSEKLSKYGGRVVVEVYDVEKEIRYNMELVRKVNGRCNLEDWDQGYSDEKYSGRLGDRDVLGEWNAVLQNISRLVIR